MYLSVMCAYVQFRVLFCIVFVYFFIRGVKYTSRLGHHLKLGLEGRNCCVQVNKYVAYQIGLGIDLCIYTFQVCHFTPQKRHYQMCFLNLAKLLKVTSKLFIHLHNHIKSFNYTLTSLLFSATVMMDKVSSRSKGFGFITFASELEAEKAINEMDRKTLNRNWNDTDVSILPIYRELMAAGLRIWVFSGDVDSVVPVTATRYAMGSIWVKFWHNKSQPGSN
ncbi:hypothetical protein LXL04_006796 [Taraxacum kok-saghyz]